MKKSYNDYIRYLETFSTILFTVRYAIRHYLVRQMTS